MNIKRIIAMTGAVSLFLSGTPFIAASKGPANWDLPSTAVQVDTDVFYLGKKNDPQSHRQVEGYAFIHRADAAVSANSRKPGGSSVCYSYLASGAKWKGTPEPWVMNPSNSRGLDTTTVFNLEGQGIAKWEDAADGIVGSGAGFNIMDNGTSTVSALTADSSAPDGQNEIYFANVSGNGVIAVTTIWGIFGGATANRVLTEWDQVYDDVDFDWSLSGEAAKMDFDNIATHEIGHAVGMGHPSNTCNKETMYAYANNGETIKRTLNTGDITGIDLLY